MQWSSTLASPLFQKKAYRHQHLTSPPNRWVFQQIPNYLFMREKEGKVGRTSRRFTNLRKIQFLSGFPTSHHLLCFLIRALLFYDLVTHMDYIKSSVSGPLSPRINRVTRTESFHSEILMEHFLKASTVQSYQIFLIDIMWSN